MNVVLGDLPDNVVIDDRTCATIYFENGAFSFPEQNWNDFVVVVLDWWAVSLVRLEKEGYGEFRFIDGPLVMRVFCETRGWVWECYNQNVLVEKLETPTIAPFSISLKKAVERLLEAQTDPSAGSVARLKGWLRARR